MRPEIALGVVFVVSLVLSLLPAVSLEAQVVAEPGDADYQIGNIKVWEQSRRLEISGVINMREGLVELLATTLNGKTHESVLVMDVSPVLLYTALGLIGLSPKNGQTSAHSANDTVFAYVEWTEKEQPRRERAENLVWDRKHNQTMSLSGWKFTGSRFYKQADGKMLFGAQMSGALIATYYDPDAILNNPLPEATDDTVYFANTNLLPPKGTAVKIILAAQAF